MLTFQIKNNLKIDKVSLILKLMMLIKNKDYKCSTLKPTLFTNVNPNCDLRAIRALLAVRGMVRFSDFAPSE